jgi:hypothetical protein
VRQRRERAGAVGLELGDQLTSDLGELAFVGVGQARRKIHQGHPRDLGHLDVFV